MNGPMLFDTDLEHNVDSKKCMKRHAAHNKFFLSVSISSFITAHGMYVAFKLHDIRHNTFDNIADYSCQNALTTKR